MRQLLYVWGVGRLGRGSFGAWVVWGVGRFQSYPIGASSNCGVVVLTLALTLSVALTLASCKN